MSLLRKNVNNMVRKEFISVVSQYPLPLPIHNKEDYFTWPLLMMKNDGYSTKIVTLLRAGQKSHEKYKGIEIIRFSNPLKLLVYLWQHKGSLIHAQGKILPLLAGLVNSRAVFTTHATLGVDDSKYFSNSILRIIYKTLLAQFQGVIAISPYEVGLLKKYGFRQNYRYIPTAIDYSYFHKPFGGREALKKYNITKTAKVIIFLGNKHKGDKTNIETLFKAFSVVCGKQTNTKLIIIGKFPPEIVNADVFKRIQNSTILTGWLPYTEFIEIFDIADVFVNTSTAEGNPLSVAEAAAAGIPLCLSGLPTLKSIYGNYALYHKPKDNSKLANNIIKCLENSDLRKHNAENTRRIIKSTHNYEHVYKLTRELYNYVLKD